MQGRGRFRGAACALALATVVTAPAAADVVPRATPAAGSVIARKIGEEVQFVDVGAWQGVDAQQDLLAGDVLRTNALGHLAVLFRDRTQVRLGRNTTLVVKQVGEASESRFGLNAGTIWARAERGGVGLTVDTPAAAAAIRGTDWTLTVDGSGKTSLVVLEGRVELFNEHGSVSVGQGEAAVATIGQAPAKVVIVTPKDREQMLFYLSAREAFGALPASPLPARRMRGEHERIAALPAAARGAEDRVTFAEVAFSRDGREAAKAAIAEARRLRLTRAQEARLQLIEAALAGAEFRYAEAARLYAAAAPHVDARRRAVAAYSGYYARSLADPRRVEEPPQPADGGPHGAVAAALTAAFLNDLDTALDMLRAAEARYPDDPLLPASRARVAMLLDRRDEARDAIDRALALDPDDPEALVARAAYRSGYQGDVKGAHADLARAVELNPGSDGYWNDLGLVEGQRGAEREAEAAFRRAIALNPQSPVARANLAILLMQQGRLEEAKVHIDEAMRLDPGFDVGLVALGLYHLHTGEIDKGVEAMLAGSTANPGYSQGQLLLSAAYYEGGQRDPAEQALANANRLDPNDPVTALFETAIAIDDYDSDRAIRSAQDAMKRARGRGGDFAPASANRDAGSALNEAFRLQGLDAWGRYYGDLTFDPFAGASYVDQTVSGAANPFFNTEDFRQIGVEPQTAASGFSTFLQGILLDPLSISGRSRSANLVRRPFFEASVGGGGVSQDGGFDWGGEIEAQAHAINPVPWSMLVDISGLRSRSAHSLATDGSPVDNVTVDFDNRDLNAFAFLTAQPTPQDRVVAFVNASSKRNQIEDFLADVYPLDPDFQSVGFDRDKKNKSLVSSLGWSHTFGYRNVANVAGFYLKGRDRAQQDFRLTGDLGVLFDPILLGVDGVLGSNEVTNKESSGYVVAANHLLGIDDFTLRYGAEAGWLTAATNTVTDDYLIVGGTAFPLGTTTTDGSAKVSTARLYADVLWDARPDLTFEAGAFVTHVRQPTDDVTRLDPRFGVAWSPAEGHWLRAGYIRDTPLLNAMTLAPAGIVGLQANAAGFDAAGYSDTFAARWDAQWTDRFFTSVDLQHQLLHELSIDEPYGLTTIDLARGEMTRAGATANFYLGAGFGLFATGAYTDSANRTPGPDFGNPIPYVAEWSGRAGVTFVHPSNVKATLAATHVGERTGDTAGAPLGSYWTLDAFMTWEPLDKRFALELAAYNLLDEAFLVSDNTPGWGRTFTGSFKARF